MLGAISIQGAYRTNHTISNQQCIRMILGTEITELLATSYLVHHSTYNIDSYETTKNHHRLAHILFQGLLPCVPPKGEW